MEEKEYREMQAREADIVEIYNLDPTQSRGYEYDSKSLTIPALGEPGNPARMPRYKALHLIKHSDMASPGIRGWLTLSKSLYDVMLKTFKALGVVTNPKDANVVTTPDKKIVIVTDPKTLAEYKTKMDRLALGLDVAPVAIPVPTPETIKPNAPDDNDAPLGDDIPAQKPVPRGPGRPRSTV